LFIILLSFGRADEITARDAPATSIAVDAGRVVGHTNRLFTGSCLEDVNHEVYGGIYSQMVFGEGFQEPTVAAGGETGSEQTGVSGMWRSFRRGTALGSYEISKDNPWIGIQCQRMSFFSGEGELGVENEGLNRIGMSFSRGKTYEGELVVRTANPVALVVALEARGGGASYCRQTLRTRGGGWERVDFSLTPAADDPCGRFSIILGQPGQIDIGYAFVQPGNWGRFCGLPVRKDVAEALIAEGNTVMRYGGAMINAPGYRWKKMIGPRDRRQPYSGTWYPFSTDGWGIPDFLDFCEAAHVVPIPTFNLNETPRDMSDFLEFANGPATSNWGKVRAANGHPEPYRLRCMEIGNEEAVDDGYWKKFSAIAEKIWTADPSMILVVGDCWYLQPISYPFNFRGAPHIASLAAHQRILNLAKRLGAEVWIDVHVATETPDDPSPGQIATLQSLSQALVALAPGAKFKLTTFELNANVHGMQRALANAHAINVFQRLGIQATVISANALQPDGQNDNGWDQGLVFLSPTRVWFQPPAYVMQMLSRSYLPLRLDAQVAAPRSRLDVTATMSDDRRALLLSVVNMGNTAEAAAIQLRGFTITRGTVKVEQLSGRPEATNTARFPDHIVPVKHDWILGPDPLVYTFPADSLSLLRFQ